jgi:hypothetical protein
LSAMVTTHPRVHALGMIPLSIIEAVDDDVRALIRFLTARFAVFSSRTQRSCRSRLALLGAT